MVCQFFLGTGTYNFFLKFTFRYDHCPSITSIPPFHLPIKSATSHDPQGLSHKITTSFRPDNQILHKDLLNGNNENIITDIP